MNSDIILNKVQTIHRCIKRINEEYLSGSDSLSDYTRQDSIILNILRACETSIDLAMYIVSERCLEVPQNSRDAFEIIFRNGIIDKQLEQKLKAMVGFRNIAVHDYQAISIEIVKGIVENHLNDFREFADIVMRL